uniref:NFX1-type zinc finger-containing protein 1 n=1 Tax=Timema monikensis TaxID=170555 RepID=A0A7R9HR13_9NEOP|nr:unnamed protein product [Timema monikensis]
MRRKEGSAEPTSDDRNCRGATEERPDKIQPVVSSRAKFVRFRAPLGHFRLEEMVKLDPNEIVEIVANKHSGFMELLGGDTALRPDMMALTDCLKDIIREVDLKKETHVEYPEPPNNFREMSVFPTLQDITSEKSSFVRPNITKGAYSDVEHYLDVQFRLLREDFIGPLREGILEYLNNIEEDTVLPKTSNLRFYNIVLFLTTKLTKDGIGVVVNFDPDRRRRIENWKESKKFMYGSLLVFTSDNFKSTIIATVIEREEKLFKKNILVVKFHSSTKIDKNLFKKAFIMAESEVYFNSYNHVLQGLQNLRKENFPMKEYIVDVNCVCKPPLYVDVEREFSFEGFKIVPTDVESWPGFKALGLNPAQYDALVAATTREFVVIQGPPGTGKTFLGLKVVDFLLQNTSEWNMQGQPILIVCHTNHALDQFLEGIAKISNSIVRIGGQSKSEILQKYNLKAIRRISRENSHNYYLSKYINDTMAHLTSRIQRKQERLELIKKNEGILWMDYLVDRNIIPSGFLDVLRTSLVEWLLVPPEEWPEEEEELDNEAQQFHEQENPEESHTANDVLELYHTLLDELLEDDRYDDDTDPIYEISLEMLNYDKGDIYEISIEKLNDQLKTIEGILKDPKDGEYFDRNLWFFDTLYDDLTYQKECLKTCLHQVIPSDEERVKKLMTESDVWRIDPRDRWLIYKHWLSLLQAEILEDLIQAGEDFKEKSSFYEEARNMGDLRILREHHVVGMTTTGAARLQPLLQALRPTIGNLTIVNQPFYQLVYHTQTHTHTHTVATLALNKELKDVGLLVTSQQIKIRFPILMNLLIVEEAAEVLESHIVVSLTKDCQHLILIGDHKQLRPSNAVYKLAREFKFDVSLFERMLNNGMHCKVLQLQHRMRPEIAELITPTIYPVLMNHSSVETYPDVKGMLKNVYFVKHNKPEAQDGESSSHSNRHEAEFLLALCQYLILQGYDGEDITILTTYSGQMLYLREVEAKLPKTKPVETLKRAACDPFLKCKLAFCKTIADECQPFLQRFQTSKPMTPYLFEAVEKLLRYLMNRCVKPDLMKCTGPKLLSIDTKKSENLILSKNIDIGFATKRLLGETAITVTERQKLEFIHECRSMLTTMIAKLQEKSPLKQKAVRGLSSLDPCVIQHSPQLAQKRFSFLLEELNHANIINDVLAENAKKEYLHFCNLKKSELQEIFRPCDQFSDEVGLDTIYGSFLIGEANYKHLWEVIKICLVLSHGNATVEGGFSVNKSLLVENMHEKTVIAQRHIHDEIQEAGGIKNIHISKKMLDYVRGARKRYHEYLEMKKQEKSEKDKKKAEKRKLDIQVKDLEGERKKLMMATEEKREAIDVELQELKKKQASLY